MTLKGKPISQLGHRRLASPRSASVRSGFRLDRPVPLDGYQPRQRWHHNPPTEKQLDLLTKFRIDVGVRTAGEASHLIEREIDRRNSLPVTDKQVWFLRAHSIDATQMSRRDAAVAIGRIKSRAVVA